MTIFFTALEYIDRSRSRGGRGRGGRGRGRGGHIGQGLSRQEIAQVAGAAGSAAGTAAVLEMNEM